MGVGTGESSRNDSGGVGSGIWVVVWRIPFIDFEEGRVEEGENRGEDMV